MLAHPNFLTFKKSGFFSLFTAFTVTCTVGFIVGCGKTSTSTADIEETGQQIGDVMASIDESGGSNGTLASLHDLIQDHRLTFARLAPQEIRQYPLIDHAPFFSTQAIAANCMTASTFGSCTQNTITRNWGGCTLGGATFTGTVLLTWGGTSTQCQLQGTSDTITRTPQFTVTGRRGATLTVSQTGSIGQRLTWTTGTGTSRVMSFTNDGIRRVFTQSSGSVLFDFSTETTSPITVTGTTRTQRTLSGGTLRVTNNLTDTTCDYTPQDIAWSSDCNCPVSGSWSATCSDGKSSVLTLNGCGSATLTLGSETQSFELDRCAGT